MGEYAGFIITAYATVLLGLLYITIRYTRLCKRLQKKIDEC